MTKDEALKYLKEAIDEIDNLKKCEILGEEHTMWLLSTKGLLKEVFGENSDFYSHFCEINFDAKGDSRFDSWYYRQEMEKLKKDAYFKGLAQAKGVLRSALQHIERFGLPEKK